MVKSTLVYFLTKQDLKRIKFISNMFQQFMFAFFFCYISISNITKQLDCINIFSFVHY